MAIAANARRATRRVANRQMPHLSFKIITLGVKYTTLNVMSQG